MEQTIRADVLTSFPTVDTAAVDALLRREIAADDTKFIVLDDDPTGVQTVHDVSVYTDWSVESIKSGLLEDNKVFYILTNSRGLTAAETTAVHKEIAANITAAARETGAIVTVENHNIINGLGSAVAEVVGETCPAPLRRIGVPDRFGEVGSIDYLKEIFGMTREDIVRATKEVLARKQ